MEKTTGARVWLEIDLNVLRDNFRKISAAVAPCTVIGVLKANAYGLGVERIAQALRGAGCGRFGVAELNEGLALAGNGAAVQILGAVLPEEILPAIAAGVTLPVGDLQTARQISEMATQCGKRGTAHFLVDTGMGRLGMPVAQAEAIIREAVRLPGVDWEGIYSHFPMAYHSGSDYTNRQMNSFETLLSTLAANGITFRWRHIANSDAVNNFPRAFANPYNAVRTGINLHGSFDSEGRRSLALISVLTLKTRLAAIRRLPAGSSIGYGCTYRLPRETRVGTISAGYADGLPLALSNRGAVLVNNIACPVLGRVSMDYTTISLDTAPEAQCGDEVICLGGQDVNAMSVEDWAQLKGTHPYDIICSFGSRVERRYLEETHP